MKEALFQDIDLRGLVVDYGITICKLSGWLPTSKVDRGSHLFNDCMVHLATEVIRLTMVRKKFANWENSLNNCHLAT